MEKNIIIGIDASRSNVAQKTGTEYYSLEIIKKLIQKKGFNFRLYSKTPLDYIERGNNSVKNVVMPFPKLWSQVRLSGEMIKNPPDVLFVPAHTIPLITCHNTVVTLHDIGFRHFPELYTPLERIYHNWCMSFSIRRAKKIIAISDSTRRDIERIYNADPKKITVIYHGYEKDKYYPLKAGERAPHWIVKMKPYIYFIGRIEAKKNIKILIKAFNILKQDKNRKEKLVLAGRPGYMYEEIRDEINKIEQRIADDIIELGYVADEKVSDLMRNASIMAFPSKFEGFGMPLVEAMASGVPVVAANTTSIPEIVNNAGLLCDPDSCQEFAAGMKKLLNNKNFYDQMVKRGLKRAEIFNWENAADKTLKVIREASEVSN